MDINAYDDNYFDKDAPSTADEQQVLIVSDQGMADMSPSQRLEFYEHNLFARRQQIEVAWLDIGKMCNDIITQKLYKQAKDESGNHFRTAKAYFQDLDRRFHEKGYSVGYSSINRFVADYRLFIESGRMTPQEAVTVGKENLQIMAPKVRKLEKEGKQEEADQLVQEVKDAAMVMGGLPASEVRNAVDDSDDTIRKGLNLEFKQGAFGFKLEKLLLWWGGKSIDVLKRELSEDQMQWLNRRMGIKPKEWKDG